MENENEKQDIGEALIKRIALTAIYFYKKEFMVEARWCWDQLMGAAEMYVTIFGNDGMSDMDIAYDALKNACAYAGVNYGDVYRRVVAR